MSDGVQPHTEGLKDHEVPPQHVMVDVIGEHGILTVGRWRIPVRIREANNISDEKGFALELLVRTSDVPTRS